VNDELRALAENDALTKLVLAGGSPLRMTSGSIQPAVAGGWIGLRIGQEVAAQDVARQHLPTTAAARSLGRDLAIPSVGGATVFRTLPRWFQDRLLQRWTVTAVEQLHVLDTTRSTLDAQVRKDCSSGRFVAQIIVATQAEATTLAQQLAAGADFAQLAAARSTDASSAGNGGELGCIDAVQLSDARGTAAASAPIGKVSDPISLGTGQFALLLVRNAPSDSDLRDAALGTVLARAQQARVEVDARYGHWDRTRGVVTPPAPPSGA
jgi:hypothetical protein